MTVVYLDRVVLLNLAVDYLLLLATPGWRDCPCGGGGWACARPWGRRMRRRCSCPGAGSWRIPCAVWRRERPCAAWPGGGKDVPGG